MLLQYNCNYFLRVATIDGDEVENLIAVALQQQISEKEEERLLQVNFNNIYPLSKFCGGL